MTDQNSQNIDLQREGKMTFHRGSALTIFGSDRREDLAALAVALLITLGVYVLV